MGWELTRQVEGGTDVLCDRSTAACGNQWQHGCIRWLNMREAG